MNKFVAFALIGSAFSTAAMAAPAAAPEETSFTRDGQTFFVKQTDMGAYTLLEGRDDHGRKFNFRLVGQRVTGHYDGQYMEFSAASAKTARLASR